MAGDIRTELWTKLAMNAAYNGISALTGQRYGVIGKDPELRKMIESILRETAAVGNRVGATLSADRLIESAWKLGEVMADALSSTAQDLIRGKRTEIDSLNGHVAAEGGRVGVETPMNSALHALVKLAERGRSASPA